MGAKRVNYITEDFDGAVICKEFMLAPFAQPADSFIVFAGKVSIIRDKDIVGFEAHGNEANWIARVDGPTCSINILGCQIRAIAEGPQAVSADDGRRVCLVP